MSIYSGLVHLSTGGLPLCSLTTPMWKLDVQIDVVEGNDTFETFSQQANIPLVRPVSDEQSKRRLGIRDLLRLFLLRRTESPDFFDRDVDDRSDSLADGEGDVDLFADSLLALLLQGSLDDFILNRLLVTDQLVDALVKGFGGGDDFRGGVSVHVFGIGIGVSDEKKTELSSQNTIPQY